MSKRARHAKVLEMIKQHRVASQEGLRELLHAQGTEVTQATLSRDIRELRLVKVPDAEGASHYSLPEEWESTPPLQTLLPMLFQSAEGVGNFLVVKTLKGGAQAVALGIDWEEWPEVVGTLAGDDTILLIFREAGTVPTVQQRLEHMAGVTQP
ncbi:MAG TPA: arginine repressor [Longimicrobiales bacterium]|nr:arginine repressor [Longimicrobiales bacterium]